MVNNFPISKLIVNKKKSNYFASLGQENGLYPFYVCSKKNKFSLSFSENDTSILLSTGGEFSIHYAEYEYSYSTDVWSIKLNKKFKNILEEKFLYLFLKGKEKQIQYLGFQGSGIKHLDKKFILKINLQIPELNEQINLIKKIENIDENIKKYNDKIVKLHNLKKSISNKLLINNNVFFNFRKLDKKSIPEGFKVNKLKYISTKITDGEHLNPIYVKNGKPIISAKDVKLNDVNLSDAKSVSEYDFKKMLSKCCPEKGDLLIVSRGATIGRVAVNNNGSPFALMGSVILIKTNKKEYIGEYLSLFFQLDSFKSTLNILSGSSAQQAIYIKDLGELYFMYPSINKQKEIVKKISLIDKLINVLRNKKEKIEFLKQSILKKNFND